MNPKTMQPIEFEPVSTTEARRVLVGAPPRAEAEIDWSHRRATREDDSLRPSTRQWIDELPAKVQPHHLAERYARIANSICDLWNQPLLCARLLTELLITRRNSRKGFPPAVALEIGALGAHYGKLHPPGRAWT